jgi:putative drug exporter of the RND superfamily
VVIAVDQGADPGAAARVAAAVARDPGVAAVAPPVVNPAGDTAVVTVVPSTAPQDAATRDLLERLRAEVVPGALDGSAARAFVGGPTAVFDDIAAQVGDRLALFLLAIVAIVALLVAMAFRSVVVALKAALTSLLSALAAFGVLVAVFQEGWFGGLLGVDSTGPIESFLPAVMFAILIGLSTDYEVFIMSRIREEHAAGRPARESITHGIAAIGRVVVAAALIMASVFLSFMLEDDRVIKEFGLGLGAAILIDALVVRMVLVPAVMALLGERAWYMPAWLDRILTRLTIEPPARPGPTPAAGGATIEVHPAPASTGGDG